MKTDPLGSVFLCLLALWLSDIYSWIGVNLPSHHANLVATGLVNGHITNGVKHGEQARGMYGNKGNLPKSCTVMVAIAKRSAAYVDYNG